MSEDTTTTFLSALGSGTVPDRSEIRLPERVEIIEVGLRDGLQNEPTTLPTEVKLALIEQLLVAGVRRLQVTSFVNPRLVPQMADAEEVCARLPRRDSVVYSGLVLNPKGLHRAQAAGLTDVDIGISASEPHSQANANVSVAQALANFATMVAQARAVGMTVRGNIQCAFGYATAGDVPLEQVLGIARRYLDLGVDELALSDTAGVANPRQVQDLLQALRPLAGNTPIILHFHDTRGLGLANVLAALACGVTRFDTAFGGLGGCPFIPGAAGNIATEDTLYLLDSLGIATSIGRAAVAPCSQQVATLLERELPGKLYRLGREISR